MVVFDQEALLQAVPRYDKPATQELLAILMSYGQRGLWCPEAVAR